MLLAQSRGACQKMKVARRLLQSGSEHNHTLYNHVASYLLRRPKAGGFEADLATQSPSQQPAAAGVALQCTAA